MLFNIGESICKKYFPAGPSEITIAENGKLRRFSEQRQMV